MMHIAVEIDCNCEYRLDESLWSASGLERRRLWRRFYEVASGASCLAAWICWKCFARVGKAGQGRIETKAAATEALFMWGLEGQL